MDYVKVYSTTYTRTIAASKMLLIRYFKKAKDKNRPFNTVNNNFIRWAKEYKEENFENRFKVNEPEAFRQFGERYTFYQGEPLDIVKWVLEDEVKTVFVGENYISYSAFVKELATYEALVELTRHYHIYYSYYELIYEQNKYEYFYLKDFEKGSYEGTDEFNEMLDVKYPNRIEERKQEEERQKKEKAEKSEKNKMSSDKDVNIFNDNTTESKITNFTDEERMLIASVLFDLFSRPNHGVSLPEFIRACKIVGLYEDLSIFTDKVQQSTIYQMGYRGINYTTNKTLQTNKIKIVLSKLESLKLKTISDRLKMMRTEVLNKLEK